MPRVINPHRFQVIAIRPVRAVVHFGEKTAVPTDLFMLPNGAVFIKDHGARFFPSIEAFAPTLGKFHGEWEYAGKHFYMEADDLIRLVKGCPAPVPYNVLSLFE